MIGGGGEKKTLRLVAQYADATNVFGGPELVARKYAILRRHCEEVGRPYAEIERSTLQNTRLSAAGGEGSETPEAAAARFAALAAAGAQHVIVGISNIDKPGVDMLAGRLAALTHAIPTT
jgi:alkanesulfonate monooxygenase SsuD/methylene tetrahydromethanopterin reductase-like flavin-dependent oxidoreductase (luciferase family)